MRKLLSCVGLQVCVLFVCPIVSASEVDAILETQTGTPVFTGMSQFAKPRVTYKMDGKVSFIAATPGTHLAVASNIKSNEPVDIARAFVREHGKALGIMSGAVGFEVERITTNKSMTFVKLAQTYQGYPVYGAEMIVAVLNSDGVTSVVSNVMTNTSRLDVRGDLLAPSIGKDQAELVAVRDATDLALSASTVTPSLIVMNLQLIVYAPVILIDTISEPKIAWCVTLGSRSVGYVPDEYIIDAHSGAILLRIPQAWNLKNRAIYDAESVALNSYGVLRRSEGQAPYGVADVDNLYDMAGLAYDYFKTVHDRDSYNGGNVNNGGARMIRATARYGYQCSNSSYNAGADRFWFCEGLVADDTVGHEYTHAVIRFTSNLLNAGESGAIAESMADIFGEFIDLVNGPDPVQNEWLIAEDINGGAIRDMDDPHSYQQPDVFKGEKWRWPYFPIIDYTHINSGVGNKLCHLLTKGDDDFYGSSFSPLASDLSISISAVSKLYYQVLVHRLGRTSGYSDLADILEDEAINAALGLTDLGNDITWNALVIQKVINATAAVGL